MQDWRNECDTKQTIKATQTIQTIQTQTTIMKQILVGKLYIYIYSIQYIIYTTHLNIVHIYNI